MSSDMYWDKFMSIYNCKTYQYVRLVGIIGGPCLLHIYSKKLLLILVHVTDN